MRLAKNTYEITRSMPKTEQFGLTSQMRRAAVSIPSNIAEGYARQSRVDYIKFLKIARGSLAELSTQYELSIELKLLDPIQATTNLMDETDRVLQGLIRSLQPD
jgi:four helix bundle protein